MSWILNNIGTILIFLLLTAVICAVIHSMRKNKKIGKTSCGCGCAGCVLRGKCHGDK